MTVIRPAARKDRSKEARAQLLPLTVAVSLMVVVPSVIVMARVLPLARPVVLPWITTLSSSVASRLPSGVPLASRGTWMATLGVVLSISRGRSAEALLPAASVAVAVRPRVVPEG